jgi:hypothetical protein
MVCCLSDPDLLKTAEPLIYIIIRRNAAESRYRYGE